MGTSPNDSTAADRISSVGGINDTGSCGGIIDVGPGIPSFGSVMRGVDFVVGIRFKSAAAHSSKLHATHLGWIYLSLRKNI